MQRTEMGCRGRPCVRAVGMACHSCAIESGMARGWPMRMSSDGAIKKIPVRRVGIAQGGHRRIAVADGSGCTHLT